MTKRTARDDPITSDLLTAICYLHTIAKSSRADWSARYARQALRQLESDEASRTLRALSPLSSSDTEPKEPQMPTPGRYRALPISAALTKTSPESPMMVAIELQLVPSGEVVTYLGALNDQPPPDPIAPRS